jgi:hypothetical protein
MEKAWAGRSREFPENAANVNRIGEMGYLKRKILGDHTYGSTSPFGTIELNMPAIKADNQDINDVLAHEMVHARQGVGGWLKGMLGSPEPDYEAINTESMRNVRRGDIPLRNDSAPIRTAYAGQPGEKDQDVALRQGAGENFEQASRLLPNSEMLKGFNKILGNYYKRQ